MKGGNPGGVLLIGAGVLLLALAYTGRGKAVWDALVSGGSAAPAADGVSAPAPGQPGQPVQQSTAAMARRVSGARAYVG